MATTYDEQIEEEIPGEFYVFSLLDKEEDEETNDVVSSLDEYELPKNVVRGEISGGGVCAHALLNVLKQNGGGKKKKKSSTKTWADALEAMQLDIREERGLDTYTPTLSTSRPTDLWSEPIRIASSSKEGVKRALLIGIHYDDDDDVKLSSCHDDTRKIRKHLIHEEGFEPQNILVMMDDNGRHHEPTKDFILECVTQLCEVSKAGDSIFFHFSGHGGRLLDEEESDEDEIPHELLTPSDYRKGGILTDDELYASFVREVPAGVHVVAVIDTCHPSPSGCALELPYVCEAGDDEVRDSGGFRSARAIMASVTAAAGAAAVTSKKKKKTKDTEPESNDQVVEKKVKKKKKVADSDDESEDFEIDDENDLEESSQSEKGKSGKKPKKKKKKKGEENEAEEMVVEKDIDESSQSEKGKSEKKGKKKKKKKGEEDILTKEEEASEEQDEQEKPKKKNKGQKDPPKEEEASEEQEDDEKPKKKKKGDKEDKKKKKTKKPKDPSNSSGGDDIGSQDEEDPPEQAPKKKKKDDAPKKKKKTKKK